MGAGRVDGRAHAPVREPAGPWLTLGLPAGLLFALFDRRLGARVVGVVVVALVAAGMVASAIGTALLAAGSAVTVVCAVVVARGERRLGMDVLVGPALGTAAVALAGGPDGGARRGRRMGVGAGGERDRGRPAGDRAVPRLRHERGVARAAGGDCARRRGRAGRGMARTGGARALARSVAGPPAARTLGTRATALGRRLAPRPFERFRPGRRPWAADRGARRAVDGRAVAPPRRGQRDARVRRRLRDDRAGGDVVVVRPSRHGQRGARPC